MKFYSKANIFRNTRWLAMGLIAMVVGCGGSSSTPPGVSTNESSSCTVNCTDVALSVADVQRVGAQAAAESLRLGSPATIAVTDRVGNVLAVFSLPGAASTFRIDSGKGVLGGLERVDILPSALAAISKALTGAYLSSAGNAFSTRTASQIIQENFNPNEANQPSGPLFGVQFSQLPCGDLVRSNADAQLGPKRAPLGLAADPGGLPLYKNGQLVGGVGVIADGRYGLDLDIQDFDNDLDERLSLAAAQGFEAPDEITANRITADGRSLRYVDLPSPTSNATTALNLDAIVGSLIPVVGYFSPPIRSGVAIGSAASGIRKDTDIFSAMGGFVLVDAANHNRYPPRASDDSSVTAAETRQLLISGLEVANRARAQIRKPAGSTAQVNVVVTGRQGEILGIVRLADAPIFGIDVALQKARSAAFFSNPGTASALQALPDARYLNPVARSDFANYVAQTRAALASPQALADGIAFSSRAIGNLSRPHFPDGIAAMPPGPLSKPLSAWSPFNNGLQLDLSINAVTAAAGAPETALGGCTGLPNLKNGLQIFPGGFPLYKTDAQGTRLVGGVGVSGDGVDQDDMISFLAIANAAQILGTGLGHAPAQQRSDTLKGLPGGALRYVQCPQAPFNQSDAQNVCTGL